MKLRGLLLTLALMLGAATTQAETVAGSKFSIPFPFYAGGKLMPAGRYRVLEDTGSARAVLTNVQTGERIHLLMSMGNHQPGRAKLTFQSGKNGYSLKAVS